MAPKPSQTRLMTTAAIIDSPGRYGFKMAQFLISQAQIVEILSTLFLQVNPHILSLGSQLSLQIQKFANSLH